MSPRPSSEKSRKSFRSSSGSPKQNSTVFYGRGGAGNVARRDSGEAMPMPDLGTPTLKGKAYTTGRGGAGNMAKNDPEHPERARERQDVDVPHVALEPERPYLTGRGGAGNLHRLTQAERAEAKQHNDRVRADSGRGNNTARDHVRDIASKAKGMFGGHKTPSVMSV